MHQEGIISQDQGRKKMKSSSETPQVSGEIGGVSEEASEEAVGFEIGTDRVGVSESEEMLRQELADTEAGIAQASAEIRKLEAAAKAPMTEGERMEMQAKLEATRASAEALYKGDPQQQRKVEDLLNATQKMYLEGREGIGSRLTRLRQRATDLAEQRKLLVEKLDEGAN